MSQVQLKRGDVVFFKQGKLGTARKAPEVRFQGHGFGLFLGHVPHFGREPIPQHLFALMGGCGFLSFDDVAEFLGDEMGKVCVAKFEAKYLGAPPEDPNQPPLPLPEGETAVEEPRPSGLIGVDGAPIAAGGETRV